MGNMGPLLIGLAIVYVAWQQGLFENLGGDPTPTTTPLAPSPSPSLSPSPSTVQTQNTGSGASVGQTRNAPTALLAPPPPPPPLTTAGAAAATEQATDPDYVLKVTALAAQSTNPRSRYPTIARQWKLRYSADEWNWFAAQSTDVSQGVVRPSLVTAEDGAYGSLAKIDIDDYLARVNGVSGMSGMSGMSSQNEWTM